MKPTVRYLFLLAVWLPVGFASANDDIPLLRPEERAAVESQADDFNRALNPALAEAARSTVRVWTGTKRLSYGTVIGDGRRILTKWSEVAAAGNLRCEGPGGEVLPATVAGVYPDDDLAVLETTGTPLTPVQWSKEMPRLGAFLAAPQPDGRPAGFGVVSVLERNLRDTDSAFLGVVGSMDFSGPGVRIEEILPDSGAAAAGLKAGQIILEVSGRSISGVLELRNSLVGRQPGESIIVRVQDGEEPRDVEILLGNRPELPSYDGARLRQMERMGGPISRVRDSFSRVIQTDMRLRPSQTGGPVVDMDGRVIGIAVARADRTRSFIMPAAVVEEMLETKPTDPSLAEVRDEREEPELRVARRMEPPPGRQPEAQSPQRMRRHLSEMQQLMDFMLEEMDRLERGR
ncbi:MAG: PDZ domain-containing protein [Luteolibacter sp.]